MCALPGSISGIEGGREERTEGKREEEGGRKEGRKAGRKEEGRERSSVLSLLV